jgi:XrtN system VIT domain protein
MDTIKKHLLKDPVYITGLIFILISVMAFMLPEMTDAVNKNETFGIFIFNYLLFITYLCTLTIGGIVKYKWGIYKNNIEYTFLLLILGLISAYSLNREMNLFMESTLWLSIYISLLGFTLIMLAFKNSLPAFLKHTLYFLFGASACLCIYLSIYLFPLYGFSAVIIFILGISGHIFVPLSILVYSLIFIRKNYSTDKELMFSFYAGLAIPLMISVYFLFQWNHINKEITYTYNESITKNRELPNWIKVSQKISDDWVTDRVMKSGLVYDVPNNQFQSFRTPFNGNGEGQLHDPLVMCASFIFGKPELEYEEKIKIMESVYDARHKAQDRLWTGADLRTSNVITNAEIYPDMRIAYTEKIITIKNSLPENTRWRATEEAIYSFHLPEGSVVTSLSLWINGREEKASLTTKGKADSAYTTVVGVEQRDPSVIHWQEGNRVSVRVFPCTPKEDRRFKVGITSPLEKSGSTLIYSNIAFEGPEYDNATESFNIQFKSDPSDLKMPSFFKLDEKNYFRYDGNYNPSWEITMSTNGISSNAFSFNNRSYSIEPYAKKYESFDPEAFYLDINKSWTEDETDAIRALAATKEVYVYKEGMIKLNDENFDDLTSELREFKFSLFPIDKIKDPSNGLLISKSPENSPNLHDLDGSDFIIDLNSFFTKKTRIRIFNIGHGLSPYLKSLKEIRVFTYDEGEIDYLTGLLKEKKFAVNAEDDNTVVIDKAEIKIKQEPKIISGNGTDHIMRLFIYNDIMKKLNTNYLNKDFFSDELISEAASANVVSPVSSLIVLETQNDYDRFGIEKADGQKIDNQSLQNASTGAFGSVPEPHEWLLIILCIGVVSFFFIKPYLQKRFIA